MREANLGKLVSLEKRRRPLRVKPAAGTEAQVVMFTGVRYQRDEPGVPTSDPSPKRPKHKRG
jgi:hypothetical protein